MPARKRRTKYTWLPVLGSTAIASEDDVFRAGIHDVGLVTETGNEDLVIVPLVVDEPDEDNPPGTSLADVIGSEYFIKRIVGKFFCTYTQGDQSNGVIPLSARVTAGFFIARADTGQNNALPVGTDEALANYSPDARVNIREPWIWRRTWILGNQGLPLPSGVLMQGPWPTNNTAYGSVLDGPHIDARTARRVRKEERLFFTVSCVRAFVEGVGGTPDIAGGVEWWLDYRVLGALRKSVARGAF